MDSSCIDDLRGRTRRSAPTRKIGCPDPAFRSIQAQKKRRMLCIVVSRLPALFERLMLLDYQIGLDLASGVEQQNIGEMNIQSAVA